MITQGIIYVPDLCKLCYFPNCPIDSWVPCTNCNRFFKSQECFDQHKQIIGQGKSLCDSFVKCDWCHNVVKRSRLRPDLHHFGQTKCSTCSQYVDTKLHLCYMQLVKERPVGKTQCNLLDDEASDEDNSHESGYNELFFDFECRQENGTHEPNLCVIHNEAGDEWVFQGDNTRNDFFEWLFTKEHANCIVVAQLSRLRWSFHSTILTRERYCSRSHYARCKDPHVVRANVQGQIH